MKELWGTNDLALATFLVMCGEDVVGFHWFGEHPESTCMICFKDSWAVRHCSRIYQTGAEVNAAVFALEYGRIKRRMIRSSRRTTPLLLAAS